MNHGSYIERLGTWVDKHSHLSLTETHLVQTKLLLLDSLGCALAALSEREPRRVINAAVTLGEKGDASIFGIPQKVTSTSAILANGALIRFLDLNDFSHDTLPNGRKIGGHPSDNIPVALAIGEMARASGASVLASIVIGYEICARLRRAICPSGQWDTTTVSGIAAAAIAGQLLGLDERRLAHAMALGAARAATPGVMRAGVISSGKFIANALIAQSGAQAALLAAEGVTGPIDIFEHPRGLASIFPDRDALEQIDAQLSEPIGIMRAHVKRYPCVVTAQSAVAAAIQMHKRLKGRWSEIEKIRLTLEDTPQIRRQIADPGRRNPQTRESADHSFTFLIAVALTDGKLMPQQFRNERWEDRHIKSLMNRIILETDPSWHASPQRQHPALLSVEFFDNTIYQEKIEAPPGFRPGSLPATEVELKFDSITHDHVELSESEDLKSMVMSFDKLEKIDKPMDLLRNIHIQ